MLLFVALMGLASAADPNVESYCKQNQPASINDCVVAFGKVKEMCENESDPAKQQTCWDQYNGVLAPPANAEPSSPNEYHHHQKSSKHNTQQEIDAYCKSNYKYYGTYKECEEHYKHWEANCKKEGSSISHQAAHECWETLHKVVEGKEASTAEQVYDYCGKEAKKSGDKKVFEECEQKFAAMEQRCISAATQQEKYECWKRIHELLKGETTDSTHKDFHHHKQSSKHDTQKEIDEYCKKDSYLYGSYKSCEDHYKHWEAHCKEETETISRQAAHDCWAKLHSVTEFKTPSTAEQVMDYCKAAAKKDSSDSKAAYTKCEDGFARMEQRCKAAVSQADKNACWTRIHEILDGKTELAAPEPDSHKTYHHHTHNSKSKTQQEVDNYCKKDGKYYGSYKACEQHYKQWEANCKKDGVDISKAKEHECWTALHEVTEFKKPSTAQQVYDYCAAEAKKQPASSEKKVYTECQEKFQKMEARCIAATTEAEKEACWQRVHAILNGTTEQLTAPTQSR